MNGTILDTIKKTKENKCDITLLFLNISEITIGLIALIITSIATYIGNNNFIKSLSYVGMAFSLAVLFDGCISLKQKDN